MAEGSGLYDPPRLQQIASDDEKQAAGSGQVQPDQPQEVDAADVMDVAGDHARAVGGKVLAITIYSHHQLEHLLRGFNAAYNARRQRVLEGQTLDQVVVERLADKPALAKDKPSGQARPCDITKARLIAENAKEVSQPDS